MNVGFIETNIYYFNITYHFDRLEYQVNFIVVNIFHSFHEENAYKSSDFKLNIIMQEHEVTQKHMGENA